MKNLRYVSTWAFRRALDGTLFRGRRGGKGSGGRKKFFVGRECPDFGTAALVKWGHQGKGGKSMTAISVICTMCGAAALSRGILKAIEYIGR